MARQKTRGQDNQGQGRTILGDCLPSLSPLGRKTKGHCLGHIKISVGQLTLIVLQVFTSFRQDKDQGLSWQPTEASVRQYKEIVLAVASSLWQDNLELSCRLSLPFLQTNSVGQSMIVLLSLFW